MAIRYGHQPITTIGEAATIIRGKYACPLCPKRYVELAAKKQHMKTKHPKERK